MGFFTAIKTCLLKYAQFSGRAPRSEFWFFYLFSILATLFLLILNFAFFDFVFFDVPRSRRGGGDVVIGLSPLVLIFWMLIFSPLLAAGVRRLHDIGRSGRWMLWFFIISISVLFLTGFMVSSVAVITATVANEARELVALIPVFVATGIGALVFVFLLGVVAGWQIVWLTTKGDTGENAYGSNPLESMDSME